MTISEAKGILEQKKAQAEDEKLKNRIDSLINDLTEYFVKSEEIESQIAETIEYSKTSINCVNYDWVVQLNEQFLQMKHRLDCRKQLSKNNNKIDGETAQWCTTIVQGVFGVISIVFTILFAVGKIPNFFGKLGDDKNTDALYYVIGTIGQQAVALVVAIIIGIVNRRRIKKMYENKAYSYDELLAVKYEGKKRLWFLSHTAAKISKNQIAIGSEIYQFSIGKQDAKHITNNF